MPKSRTQVLKSQAQSEAKRLKSMMPSGPKLLSESQQMADFKNRALKGHAGFEDITSQHGLGGLGKYLSAMSKLHQKNGIPLPQPGQPPASSTTPIGLPQ